MNGLMESMTVAATATAFLVGVVLLPGSLRLWRARARARRRHPSGGYSQLPWCACGAPDSAGAHGPDRCRVPCACRGTAREQSRHTPWACYPLREMEDAA